MNIFLPNYSYPNFTGAKLNINALSDSHGALEKINVVYKNMQDNKDSIFLENKRGNQNALIVAGDWFISGASGGYKSDKSANSHKFQIRFFNEFVKRLNELSGGQKTFFVPGNHEFDGGEDEFKKVVNSIDTKVLMTNLDVENSPALKEEVESGKIVREEILEIADDKDENKLHKCLFLGVNPVNMPYYKKGMKGINFINQPFKAQKNVTEEDFKETFEEVQGRVEKFKQENPNGLVVLSCHTGAGFAEKAAETLGEKISIIFDGHEHKDGVKEVNGVQIVRLSQNFKKYVNVKLEIDDNGKLKADKEIISHYPLQETPDGNGFFKGFFDGIFKEDLEKEYKITPEIEGINILDTENIRSGNSFLANFITDSILTQIQKTNPEVEIFGLNASAVRHSLETAKAGGENNLSVIEVLSGIVHGDAMVFKNELTGEEIIEIILDNYLFNEKDPERNPLMQWAGIVVDKKSLLEEYHSGKSLQELKDNIILAKTGKPVDLEGKYTVANVEKFFKKSKNPLIKEKLYAEAIPLNSNARELFKDYMEENKNNLRAKCDVRILT